MLRVARIPLCVPSVSASVVASALFGCGVDESADGAQGRQPVALADQEDAVCGMLVREQSAPRGQVVHRDGERSFLCSIGDLLAYLAAPSPHGAPARVLVEVLQPTQDPALSHTGPHPWIVAEEGVYVVGIERERIMGAPVLIYRDRAAAGQVIATGRAAEAERGAGGLSPKRRYLDARRRYPYQRSGKLYF